MANVQQTTIALCFSGTFCGGAERMMMVLQTLLDAKGYCTPLLLNGSGEVATHFKTAGQKIHQLNADSFANKWNPLPYGWQVLRMGSMLRRLRPKLLIVEGKILTQIAVIAGRLTGVPVVSYVHYPPTKYEVSRMMYNKATEVVLCCEGLRPYFSETAVPCTVVRNFIDVSTFSSADDETRAILKDKIFGVSPQTVTVSLVGHLSEIKGQSTLLRAVATLKKRNISVAVALAGSDNDPTKQNKRRLESEIVSLQLENEVRLLGKVDQPQEVYRASDISVLPSLREGLPLAVLEAMACGLPVVATAIDGTPEAVVDGSTGYLIEPNNVEQLADRLQDLIADKAARESFGLAGRERVETQFTEEKWQNDFIEVVTRHCS